MKLAGFWQRQQTRQEVLRALDTTGPRCMVEERGREGLGCSTEPPGNVVREAPAGSEEEEEEAEEEEATEEEGFQ